jgi:hypothetical protein
VFVVVAHSIFLGKVFAMSTSIAFITNEEKHRHGMISFLLLVLLMMVLYFAYKVVQHSYFLLAEERAALRFLFLVMGVVTFFMWASFVYIKSRLSRKVAILTMLVAEIPKIINKEKSEKELFEALYLAEFSYWDVYSVLSDCHYVRRYAEYLASAKAKEEVEMLPTWRKLGMSGK